MSAQLGGSTGTDLVKHLRAIARETVSVDVPLVTGSAQDLSDLDAFVVCFTRWWAKRHN
jgi:hypothetical protein